MTKTSNRDSIQCRRFLWLLKSENNFFLARVSEPPKAADLFFFYFDFAAIRGPFIHVQQFKYAAAAPVCEWFIFFRICTFLIDNRTDM